MPKPANNRTPTTAQEKPRPVNVDAVSSENLVAKYGAHYKWAGTYPLRPGVELYLLVRKDIAGPEAKEIDSIVAN